MTTHRTYFKQLLDKVFVISGIIKVLFLLAVRELDIAVRALDIALGNHVLRAQPTDYSLICRYRSLSPFEELKTNKSVF